MKEKEKKNTIVKRMIFAVAAGFVVGFLMLFLREFLLESGKSGIWKTVDAIFFQDVTKTNGIEGDRYFIYCRSVVYERTSVGYCSSCTYFAESGRCAVWQIRRDSERLQGRHLSHTFAFM